MTDQISDQITWDDFARVDMRVGEIVAAEELPGACKPAYILTVDFGPELGKRKSSALITDVYEAEDLIGKRVMAVVNFPPKQIGPMMSECLVTGFYRDNGAVVLCVPDRQVPLGAKLG